MAATSRSGKQNDSVALYTNDCLRLAFYVECRQVVEQQTVFGLVPDRPQQPVTRELVVSRTYVDRDGRVLRPMTTTYRGIWPEWLLVANEESSRQYAVRLLNGDVGE